MSPGALQAEIAGEAVWLLPAPALWWPAASTVFVADVHLGKAATFRARGLPVPAGTTQDNIARIDAVLAATGAARLVVLGDFLHAAEAHTLTLRAALAAWRGRWPALQPVLVRGNHDSHAGDPPPEAGFEVVTEPWRLGPFACCHHPQEDALRHVLAGHVHPAVQLRGPANDRVRLPCFASDATCTVLPAFGAFTGTHALDARVPGRRLWAVGAGAVWRVPAAAY